MREFFPVLTSCPLFAGISEEELPVMLSCMGAQVRRVRKRQTVFSEGEPARVLGVVLSGGVHIARDDIFGNRSVIAALAPGQLFAETFACAGISAFPVSVIADSDGALLLLDCARVLTPCQSACAFHTRLIGNLMRILAGKNLMLRQKLDLLAQRTTRGKLMAYLLGEAKAAGSRRFTIPFDRQGLANYLGVDRSAMSAELSRLRRDGVIDFHKSAFELLAHDAQAESILRL